MSMLSFYKALLQLLTSSYGKVANAFRKRHEKTISTKKKEDTFIISMSHDVVENIGIGKPRVVKRFTEAHEGASLVELRNISDGLAESLEIANTKFDCLDEKVAKLV